MRRFAVVAVLLLAVARPVAAQPDTARVRPAERSGLDASLAFGNTALRLDGVREGERPGTLVFRIGVRLRPPVKWGGRVLSLTPHVAYTTTDVRGVSPDEPFAFSHLDYGLQLSARVARHLRPYAIWRFSGKRTIERIERDTTFNLWGGGGRGGGFGVEIPITRGGRGLDVGFTTLTGRFDTIEWIDRGIGDDVEFPTSRHYRARVVWVGWSGAFRGSDLPWR